jgi:hypothetical protein
MRRAHALLPTSTGPPGCRPPTKSDLFTIIFTVPDEALIGVLDSGMGGISVHNEMRQLLPRERFVYVADSGHVPYGPKPPEYIQARCTRSRST